MKVTLLGPVPPPHGGVSVHLERLMEALTGMGIEVRWENEQEADESFLTFLQRVARTARKGILHSHVHNPWTLCALGMRATLGRPTIVTIHNPRLENWLDEMPAWKARVVRWRLHRLDGYIAVSESVREMLLRLGVTPERIVVEPAFLPPSKERWVSSPVPPHVDEFIKAHEEVIAMNAFHLADLADVPLYGADMAPSLLARVRAVYPSAGLVLYVASEPTSAQQEAMEALIEKHGMGHNLLMVAGSEPFGPLLVRSQVYVRPTATDGDSVSVREALAVGVPVVASDVCTRPAGTVTFRNRDEEGLADAVIDVLRSERGAPTDTGGDSVARIVQVYRKALKGKHG